MELNQLGESSVEIRGQNTPGTENRRCKGCVAGICLVCVRNSEQVKAAGEALVRRKIEKYHFRENHKDPVSPNGWF